MKKSFIVVAIIIALWSLLTVSIYAEETDANLDTEQTYEDVMRRLDITFDDIKYNPVDLTTRLESFEVVDGISSETVEPVENYDTIGSFVLSNGFGNHQVSTFNCEKNLVGQGDADSTVTVLVYTVETLVVDEEILEHEYKVSYWSSKVLGASGLYTETISLSEQTTQYVTIIVSASDSMQYRTYKVTTLEDETRVILENIDIDFIKEDLEEEADVDSFMDWFGSGQELEF